MEFLYIMVTRKGAKIYELKLIFQIGTLYSYEIIALIYFYFSRYDALTKGVPPLLRIPWFALTKGYCSKRHLSNLFTAARLPCHLSL